MICIKNAVINIIFVIESIVVLLGLNASAPDRYRVAPILSIVVSIVISTYLFFCVCIFLKPKSSYYEFLVMGALLISMFVCNAFLKDHSADSPTLAGKVALFVVISTFAANLSYNNLLKKNHSYLYWICSVITASVTTILAVVLNSYWHYLAFNAMFSEPVSNWKTDYKIFIENDITYNIGFIAPLRYPVLFMFVIFVFLIGFILYRKQEHKRIMKNY